MRRRTTLQRTVEKSRIFQDTLNSVIDILRRNDLVEIPSITSIEALSDLHLLVVISSVEELEDEVE
jgi:hypothetical protein